jgi:predicted RNase H-like HicB family nuclease
LSAHSSQRVFCKRKFLYDFSAAACFNKKFRYIAFMKLRLLVELDPETNRWSAVFPELPGCASAGDTEAEAIANAKEALELWFEPAPVKLNKGAKLLELAIA